MALTNRVCPRCGDPATAEPTCANCGLDIAAQYELPTRAEWEARQGAQQASPQAPAPPPAAPTARPTAPPGQPPAPPARPAAPPRTRRPWQPPSWVEIGALVLAAGATFLVVIATFLPWLSFLESFSYWQVHTVLDVLLIVVAVGLLGLGAARVIWPGSTTLRVLLLAGVASLLSFVTVVPIEFAAQAESLQAGEIVALLGGIGLTASLVLLVVAAVLTTDRPAGSAGWPHPLLLTGLALITVAALLDPLVALLPLADGRSAWELAKVGDILGTLIDVAIAAVAFTTIFLSRVRPLAVAAMAGGFYLGAGALLGGIELLAGDAGGAAVYLSLFLIAPLAIGGAVLTAIRAYPRPESGAKLG